MSTVQPIWSATTSKTAKRGEQRNAQGSALMTANPPCTRTHAYGTWVCAREEAKEEVDSEKRKRQKRVIGTTVSEKHPPRLNIRTTKGIRTNDNVFGDFPQSVCRSRSAQEEAHAFHATRDGARMKAHTHTHKLPPCMFAS